MFTDSHFTLKLMSAKTNTNNNEKQTRNQTTTAAEIRLNGALASDNT